jgi:hypothetical protein
MKEVHEYKPEKKPTNYQVLKILIKDSHVYELTDKLLSLKKSIFQRILKFQTNIILMIMKNQQ